MTRKLNPQRAFSSLPGRLAAALLSGVLYYLAYPGVGWWPLGLVAWLPLLLALRGERPRRALLFGWVTGLGMTLPGFWWLLELLERFGGFPQPISLLFLVLLCAYQAGRVALLAWLSARATERGRGLSSAFALAFVASELIYPLLFPWFFGGILHQLPVLLQLAELGGPIAVGLTLVSVNLLLYELFAPEQAWPERARRAALWAALPVVSVLFGMVRLTQVDARVSRAPHGVIGLVQGQVPLDGPREAWAAAVERQLRLTRELSSPPTPDLVVWSESSVPSAFPEAEVNARIEHGLGAQLGAPALLGVTLARRLECANDADCPPSLRYLWFNSALLTDARGRVVGRYDKRYRLPFGEYIPFGDSFPALYEWSPNSGRFSAGSSLEPLRLSEHRIAPLVCYEDVLPGYVRELVNAGDPELLVNVTNDSWFGDSHEPGVHLALAQFRAIEHRRFLVRATNSGVTAIVDPAGRVQQRAPAFQAAALKGSIAWLQGRTFYGIVGDAPAWIVALMSAWFALRKKSADERE